MILSCSQMVTCFLIMFDVISLNVEQCGTNNNNLINSTQ